MARLQQPRRRRRRQHPRHFAVADEHQERGKAREDGRDHLQVDGQLPQAQDVCGVDDLRLEEHSFRYVLSPLWKEVFKHAQVQPIIPFKGVYFLQIWKLSHSAFHLLQTVLHCKRSRSVFSARQNSWSTIFNVRLRHHEERLGKTDHEISGL